MYNADMPKLLRSTSGYYFVDSWENVITIATVTTRLEMESYKGDEFLPNARVRKVIEEQKIPERFVILGSEDEDTELGYERRTYWAHVDHCWYVPNEPVV